MRASIILTALMFSIAVHAGAYMNGWWYASRINPTSSLATSAASTARAAVNPLSTSTASTAQVTVTSVHSGADLSNSTAAPSSGPVNRGIPGAVYFCRALNFAFDCIYYTPPLGQC